MKIPPEYSEFCFYSVYSRGSISLHQNGAVFLYWFYALCFAAGAFSWGMFALFPASCSFHMVLLGYLADDPAGISGSQTIGWDVSCHNTSCSDHTAFSDGNAATNHYVGCQPAIILYGDGPGIFQIINASIFSLLDIPFFRQKRMHGSCQCDIWPDHHIVPDMDFTYI